MSSQTLVVAVDGPAGAGKSTVVRRVAATLGILYLDTGAMYRACTVGLYASGVDVDDPAAIAAWAEQRHVDFDADGAVRLDGTVVPDADLRSPDTTRQIWRIADNPGCRAHLVATQQAIVAGRGTALEGRDATTVVAPDATLKIYLDASPEERARRRLAQWADAGDAPAFAEVVADIRERDARDMGREHGALKRADDAVVVDTDGMTPDQVVAHIVALAVQRRPMVLEQRVADQLIVGRSRAGGYVRVAQGSIMDPPAPWQLGLTNPSPDRMPGRTVAFARNGGGRQAGVLCQGRAVLALGGNGQAPGPVVAMPVLPQTWYVIEPGVWHAVVQVPGTICAWAESSIITEERRDLAPDARAVLETYCRVYLGDAMPAS